MRCCTVENEIGRNLDEAYPGILAIAGNRGNRIRIYGLGQFGLSSALSTAVNAAVLITISGAALLSAFVSAFASVRSKSSLSVQTSLTLAGAVATRHCPSCPAAPVKNTFKSQVSKYACALPVYRTKRYVLPRCPDKTAIAVSAVRAILDVLFIKRIIARLGLNGRYC